MRSSSGQWTNDTFLSKLATRCMGALSMNLPCSVYSRDPPLRQSHFFNAKTCARAILRVHLRHPRRAHNSHQWSSIVKSSSLRFSTLLPGVCSSPIALTMAAPFSRRASSYGW